MTQVPNDDTINAIVTRHQAGLYRFLLVIGARPDEAADMAQECFISLLKSARRRKFAAQSEAQTSTWLRRAAKHRLIDQRRRKGAEALDIDALDAAWQALTPGEDMAERLAKLEQCREALESRAAEAIRLRYEEKLSSEELAARLGTSADGARSLLKRTRAILRECIEKHQEHEHE